MTGHRQPTRALFAASTWLILTTSTIPGIALGESAPESKSSWENAVLVLPFKAPESAKGTEDAYLGFALANLFENMLAVHDGLAECWLNWHLTEIFSKADDFEEWFASDTEVPPKVKELHLRYILAGKVQSTRRDLKTHLVLLDQTTKKRWEEDLTIDLPHLQEVRGGLLQLLKRAGIKASPVQLSKLLWKEKLSRQSLVLLGQGVHGYEITLNYGGKGASFDSEYFERALGLSPASYLLLDNLGWVQFKRNNYSAATETLRRALQSNHAGSDAIDGIIACAEQEGDDVLGATWTGRKAEAQNRDAKAPVAAFWNQRGDKAYDRGDFQVASELYRKAVSLMPSKALYLSNLAFALAKLRDFVQAESCFKQVLEMENADTAAGMANLAWLYQETQQNAKAEPLYLEALRIRKKVLGAEDPDVANSLNNLAGLYHEMGNYGQAEPLYLEALRIRKKVLGAEHPDVANSLNNLAELYRDMGNYGQAEPLYLEALRIRKQVLGAEHPSVATSLNNLALLYYQMSKYGQAEPLYLEALRIRKKVLGAEHPMVATSLNNLGGLYEDMGNYGQAEPLYLEALRIRKKMLGVEHPDVATSLNNLAVLYDDMGNYAQAERLYLEALRIRKKVLGAEHPAVAVSLNNLANLYGEMGNYGQAEPLHLEALRIQKKVLGAEHPDVATSLNNLAAFYHEMGNYGQAEPLYLEALRIRKKVLGAEHPDVATSLNNLGGLYSDMGNYGQAEPLYLEALRIRRKVLGAEHPDVANSLNNLAELYRDMGNYGQAEPLQLEALRIRKQVLGAEHPTVTTSLNNLALLYYELGNYSQAEPLYLEALRIRKKVLGAEHPMVATSLNNLGGLYEHMGKYTQAEPLYLEALRIRKQVLGAEHPDVANSLHNLAGLYSHMGDYGQAEPFCLEALRIQNKVFGSVHPDTIRSVENLVCLDLDLGRQQDAGELARRVSTDQLALFAKILSFTSEQQRLAYQKTTDFFSYLAVTPNNDEQLGLVTLRCKGAVLDSLIEDQTFYRAKDRVAGGENLLQKLALDRQEIDKLLLGSSQPAAQTQGKVDALQQEVQAIESKLAASFTGAGGSRRALSVTPAEISSALPWDTVLVEYLRYYRYLGRGNWQPAYGAMLLLPGAQPKFVALPSDSVNSAIKRYRHLANQDDSDDATVTKVLSELYGDLWDPIQKLLPNGVKRVIISPDGQLNFVSFATLLDSDQQFLAEKFALEYVTTGRDLLESVKSQDGRDCVLVGNPDFEGTLLASADRVQTRGVKMRGRETENLEDLQFASLTGTEAEVDEISKAIQAERWDTTVLTGRAATKAALLALHHPYILHIATHGFFEPVDAGEPENEGKNPIQENRRKYFNNPMHRSGLALAGANLTVAAWRQKNPPETDGILTAEDAGTLDLEGTWLVILSACDTGAGESSDGEGVMGLRRGFLEAGAQNLLMTLWPVNDQATVDLMKDFYAVALDNHNAPLALAEVQRDWLVKLHKERGVAAAVQLAGSFILTFRGKP
jgi:CHAT domain-containing protein/Tfp pilus assembly protein PilF